MNRAGIVGVSFPVGPSAVTVKLWAMPAVSVVGELEMFKRSDAAPVRGRIEEEPAQHGVGSAHS